MSSLLHINAQEPPARHLSRLIRLIQHLTFLVHFLLFFNWNAPFWALCLRFLPLKCIVLLQYFLSFLLIHHPTRMCHVSYGLTQLDVASQRLIWISRLSLLHVPKAQLLAKTPSSPRSPPVNTFVLPSRERERSLQLPVTPLCLPSSPSNSRGPFVLPPVFVHRQSTKLNKIIYFLKKL